MIIVSVVLVVALILGLASNKFLRALLRADDVGSSVADLLSPVAVLAALFIGLVLSDVTSSYSAARSSAADEANVVDNLFETTEYLPTRCGSECKRRSSVTPGLWRDPVDRIVGSRLCIGPGVR